MSISIQLTDEQAKQLAAEIAKLNKPHAPPPLPSPPEGFHPAIMGPINVLATRKDSKDVMRHYGETWKFGLPYLDGGSPTTIYALRIGSEIARLNGLEPEAKPEPRKARECKVRSLRHGFGLIAVGHIIGNDEEVPVREILPGEPTQEQVQALVEALGHALERLNRLKSYHGGTSFTIPSFDAAIAQAEAALTPFRK